MHRKVIEGFNPIPVEKSIELTDNTLKTSVLIKTSPTDSGSDLFDVYFHASDETLNGNIVCEFEVECESDFYMKGAEADEPLVTSMGMPTIPGSVIKGFLRHSCYKTPKMDRNRFMGYNDPELRWTKDKVNDIFGSQQRRSRLLVSDAFFDGNDWIDHVHLNDNKKPEKIKRGARLKCWLVFDNVS